MRRKFRMLVAKVRIEDFKRFLEELSDIALIKTIRLSGRHYLVAYSAVGGR